MTIPGTLSSGQLTETPTPFFPLPLRKESPPPLLLLLLLLLLL